MKSQGIVPKLVRTFFLWGVYETIVMNWETYYFNLKYNVLLVAIRNSRPLVDRIYDCVEIDIFTVSAYQDKRT